MHTQVNCFASVDEPVMGVRFSPDDERVAGVSAGGSLMLYLTNTTSRAVCSPRRKPAVPLHLLACLARCSAGWAGVCRWREPT